MAAEKQWRRTWKENLKTKPWNRYKIEVGGMPADFLVKNHFTADSYEILISDLSHVYYEALDTDTIKKRNKKLNPSIEAPQEKLIDNIRDNIEEQKKSTSYSASYKETEESKEVKIILTISAKLAGLPFIWKFSAKPVDKNMVADQLTLPLMCMIAELNRRQLELQLMLYGKDKEIEDLKSQGVTVSRKHFETAKFDETSFLSNMQFSKGFEDTVQHLGMSAFVSNGQQLYTDVMMKRAWLNRSDDVEMEADDSQANASQAEGGQSWSNRLPPSLALSPKKSPLKRPANSPAKAAAAVAADTSEETQAEMVRKQALQKRIAEEETKKEQKQQKKKKKMKF